MAQIVFFQQPYLLRTFSELARQNRSVVVYGQAKRSGFGPIEIERVGAPAATEVPEPRDEGTTGAP